eukprot:3262433-Pleurochrysis_carterae.AAC.1
MPAHAQGKGGWRAHAKGGGANEQWGGDGLRGCTCKVREGEYTLAKYTLARGAAHAQGGWMGDGALAHAR